MEWLVYWAKTSGNSIVGRSGWEWCCDAVMLSMGGLKHFIFGSLGLSTDRRMSIYNHFHVWMERP